MQPGRSENCQFANFVQSYWIPEKGILELPVSIGLGREKCGCSNWCCANPESRLCWILKAIVTLLLILTHFVSISILVRNRPWCFVWPLGSLKHALKTFQKWIGRFRAFSYFLPILTKSIVIVFGLLIGIRETWTVALDVVRSVFNHFCYFWVDPENFWFFGYGSSGRLVRHSLALRQASRKTVSRAGSPTRGPAGC